MSFRKNFFQIILRICRVHQEPRTRERQTEKAELCPFFFSGYGKKNPTESCCPSSIGKPFRRKVDFLIPGTGRKPETGILVGISDGNSRQPTMTQWKTNIGKTACKRALEDAIRRLGKSSLTETEKIALFIDHRTMGGAHQLLPNYSKEIIIERFTSTSDCDAMVSATTMSSVIQGTRTLTRSSAAETKANQG